MKLSEQIKNCLDGSGCGNCEHHEADTKFTCRGLLEKAYERIKGYEDMFPCEVGDKLYYPIKTQNRIAEFEIAEIQIFKDETVFFDDSDNLYHAEDFEKEVFLTREQAESALHKMNEMEGKE